MCFSSRCFFVWRVRHCRSSDYGKCVPHLGSTWNQEVAEGQGVRHQRKSKPRGSESATQGNRRKRVCRGGDTMGRRENEAATQGKLEKRVCRGRDERMKQGKNQEREQKRGTRKKNQEKEKPPASIEGKLILAGGKLKAGWPRSCRRCRGRR